MRSIPPSLPRVCLGSLPTPVHPIEGLSRGLGLEVWVKREDLSGATYGGNKVRKLEWLLGEARARGAHTVLTAGTLGSHHVLATALYSRQLGLECHAVLYPQPMSDHARRTLAAALGQLAGLTWAGSALSAPFAGLRALAATTQRGPLRLPVIIAPGGSSPVGVLGDLCGALELAAQVRQGLVPEPAWVVVPLGSGGTTAGLALGLEWAGLKTQVLAARAVHGLFANRLSLWQLMRGTCALLRRHGASPPSLSAALGRVRVDGSAYGPGYALPSPGGQAASSQLQGELALDPTYTAKAAACLIANAAQLRGPVVLWHTVNSRDLNALEPAAMPLAHLPAPVAAALPQGLPVARTKADDRHR